MPKGVWSKGRRSGVLDHGALYPITAGVPQGGSISPVVRHWVLDGLAGVVHGRAWQRRVHHSTDVRGADDFIVTANSRPVWEDTIRPRLIERLNPVWRGWANDPRHRLWAATFAKLDSVVWRRLYRWAKQRHPDKTGRWITSRYFPQQAGESWRCTAPTSGLQSIRVHEAVTPQRHMKIKGDANPVDPQGAAYCPPQDRQRALRTTSVFRAKLLNQPPG
jgi:hypothetical protein